MRQPKSEITRTRGDGIFALLGLEFAFEEWMIFASCYGLDPTPWYPEKGGDTDLARKICNRCYVKDECLRYALENHEEHGVWGGKTSRQRNRMLLRKCCECDLETTAASLEEHQMETGHTGWAPVQNRPAHLQPRFKCGGCDLVTSVGPLGNHQRATGHKGRDSVAQPPA